MKWRVYAGGEGVDAVPYLATETGTLTEVIKKYTPFGLEREWDYVEIREGYLDRGDYIRIVWELTEDEKEEYGYDRLVIELEPTD